MGNKTTRDQLTSLQDQNLTEAEQLQIEELLWNDDFKKFTADFKQFQDKYASGLRLREMFPVSSEFAPAGDAEAGGEEKRLLDEVVRKMTQGFSSSEYKLNELQQGEFRNFQFKTIPAAKAYESMQLKKNTLLVALYLARNKGGGAASRQTLLEFFKENTKQEGSKNARLSLRIGSLFNPKHPLTKLQDTAIESYYEVLKEQIREMLGAWHGADTLDPDGSNQFEVDMQLLPVREILVKALEDDTSGASDEEVRTLCLRLLTRMGMLTKNPETLLMAGYLQKKLSIDITHELKPILGEAERFDKPEKEIQSEDFVLQSSTLKDKVAYLDTDDLATQITLSYDAFAADKNFFYNYSELRGLTRAEKGPLGNWRRVDAIKTDCKGLRGVSMVVHDGKLLVRHSGIKDQPFIVYDKDTLSPVEANDDSKFKFPEGDDEKLKKLDWSEEKLPKEEEDEEEKQTEEQKAEEERRRPRRRIGATPLCSDGKHIYALSMQMKQEEEDGPVVYEKLTVEVFEIAEGNEVKRVRDFALKKDDADWTYKAKKYNSDGGYFDHAQCACNGRVFVLNLPHRTYFFKAEGGERFALSDKRKEGDHFQLVHDQESNTFSAFQVNTFQGFQNRIKIKGFEKRKTEEEVVASQAPEVLQSGKDAISSEIDAGAEGSKEPEKLNMYAQLIEGQVDCSQILTQATENLQKRKTSKVADVHELSQAVILTTMAQKADQFDVDLENLGQTTVIGEGLLAYFRKDHCIYLTKAMFKYLNLTWVSLSSQQAQGEISVYTMASLSALIRLVRINLRCLGVCRVDLDQIITQEEYKSFEEMRTKFDATFGPNLKRAVETATAKAKAAAEARAQEKEEENKKKEAEEAKGKEAKEKEESKGAEAEAQPSTAEAPADNALEFQAFYRKMKTPDKEEAGAAAAAVTAEEEVKTVQITTTGKPTADGEPKTPVKTPAAEEGEKASEAKTDEAGDKKKAEEGKDDEDEKEKEAEEEETVEQVAEKWKKGERFAELITKQAKELGDMLNKIFHSTNPSSRMEALAESLKKARNDDSAAISNCLLVFEALTNDKNMREILRGKSEDFEHCKEVIKICTDLAQVKELRALRSEANPGSTQLASLENSAAAFVKCYVRQHCSVYADLLFEIAETDLPPKKEPAEGEEEEEEDDETKDKRKRNTESKDQLKVIQEQLFNAFILLSQKHAEQVDTVTELLREKRGAPAELMEVLDHIGVCFASSESHSKNARLMAWYFNFIELEVTWLDEVAEGLKNIINASNRFRNFFDGLPVELLWKGKTVSAWHSIVETMRQACYTLGRTAHQLIAPKDEEAKEEEQKEKKGPKIDFTKLTMLQGGLERRFIPELSDKTKQLIEGFFKITQDDELRDLSLKGADEAERTEEDTLLEHIAEKPTTPRPSLDGNDYVEVTLEVLQHAACQRKGPRLRVGGADGMRLTRAAFAVIIKFSEQVPLFQKVWDEVEEQALGLDDNIQGAPRLNELAKALRESHANEFEVLCTQWEQASQIRKWTQELKKDLSESLKKECTDEMIAEISAKMKKEKEEKKAEAKSETTEAKEGANEETKESESAPAQSDKPAEESKTEETKEEAKEESNAAAEETKAQEGKTEESKEVTEESKEGKAGEGEEKKEAEEKKEDEEEDGEGFTGPLSAEQQAEVEDRAFKRMQEKMAEAVADAVAKAKFVLKMMIPEAYQAQKTEELQRALSRRRSQNVERESQGSGLVRAPSIKKRQSILVVENTLNRKDTEFDWKDRLKQWNQVQLSLGTITSFSQLGDAAFKSIPLTALALMQAKFSIEKLKEEVEKVTIKGLRRSAGLDLISFGIQTNIGAGTFQDLLQWFLTALRANRHQVAHYSDGISGCGDSVQAAIRKQFFKVIRAVTQQIKRARNSAHLIHYLNALIWNYKGSDLNYLAELDVLGVLQHGDGGRTHPIRLSWGKQIKQKKQSEDSTLTRAVANLFEFLFKQILSQVILVDGQKATEQGGDRAQAIAEKQGDGVSFEASQTLASQVFDAIFANLQRYHGMLEHFDMGPERLFVALNNSSDTLAQEESDRLADDKVFFEAAGGEAKVMEAFERDQIANTLKFNAVCQKVAEQELANRSDYCLALAALVEDQVRGADAASVLAMVKARDPGLELALKALSCAQLELPEPSNETIALGLKESKRAAVDDSYKMKYERLQELLKKMNAKLAEKEISVDAYRQLFKRLADSFPVGWLYTLYTKDLDRHWRDGGNFDKEEFKTEEECKGISELQGCQSTDKAAVEEEPVDDEATVERRCKRKELCKKCFWLGAFLNILDSAPALDAASPLARILTQLPDTCEAISQEPDATLQAWTSDLPAPEVHAEELVVKDRWYLLLQRVNQPRPEAEPSAEVAVAVAPALEEEKDQEAIPAARLAELRKVRKEPTKKSKLTLKSLYHESFFFRILGLMDFYTSLALASPAALALVQQFADPRRLNILVKFLAGGLSRGKIIVLRIFQALMKLDFPTEIFDRAVEISCKDAASGSGHALDIALSSHVKANCTLDLGNVPFLKLIYSMILSVQETVWSDSKQANKGRHVLGFELARVFKSLPQNGERNLFIQKLVASKIKEALLQIERCSGPEIEAIMGIVNESSPNQIHVGAACANQRNQVFTVLGFSDKAYSKAKGKPQDLDFTLEFDPANPRQHVYGLYFDASSPERQEIVDCQARETRFVREIDEVLLLSGAKNSPFYSQEVVAHFLQILRGSVSCATPFTQSLLRNYIIRGVNNMIAILHNKYLQFLGEAGLSQDLVAFIIEGAGAGVAKTLPRDAVRTTITRSEIKVDQMRAKALTSNSSLKKSTPHKLCLGPSRESALVMIQEDRTVKFLRVQTSKYLAFEPGVLKALTACPLKVGEQINVDEPPKKAIAVVPSSALQTLDKDTSSIVKASPYVLSDDGFDLATFVSKVEPLIEADKDQAALARTSFIVVARDAFDSLMCSVGSQESKLAASEEERAGLAEDELTKALSKLASGGVKTVTTHLSKLIDLKMPEESAAEEQKAKSAFDLIEDRVLELTNESTKGEEFEKKKKEIQTQFAKVTGKKAPADAEEKKEDATKPEEDAKKVAADEEEKKEPVPANEATAAAAATTPEAVTAAEEVKEDTPPTVLIDTTGGAESKPAESPPAATPVPSNEAKSDIQRALNMTDELNNHATIIFEQHDATNQDTAHEDLQKFFVEATRVPDRKVALHELYREEMEILESLQCRATFFNLLAFGYKSYEGVSADVDMTNERFAQLQGLIFNELCETQYQSERTNDKELLKVCKKKIKKMYKIFFNSPEFEQFAVQDLLTRGTQTIEAIRADPDFDLDELTASNLSTKIKTGTVSDPFALGFLAAQLIGMGKLSLKSAAPTLARLYEIFLSLAVLFGADAKAKAGEAMLQTAMDIMSLAQEHIEDIEENDEILDQFVNNHLFRWICSGLNFDTTFKVNRRKNKIMQIQTMMYTIQGQVLDRMSKKIEIAAKVNRFITDALKQKAIFEDGKTFKRLTNGLHLKHILASAEDAPKVQEDARVYVTDKKMFKVPVQVDLRSDAALLKVHFNRVKSANSVKLTSSGGASMTFGAEQLKDGIKNYIMDADSTAQLTLQQESQLVHLGNQDYSCDYSAIDFKGKLAEAGGRVSQVVCAFACTLFVCEDESLYAVGRPHTYNERWHDAYQSKRSWAAVNKPADCTDYKKVVASGSNFLILTKAGQLFCHGENLRLYFDSDVEKERATTEFVNCTDLFPVDDGDQIVDVAAGYFHTLAVTEGGSAYAVGLDKYRSYYTHIEGILDRKPAYQIELPGRAVACWAHKTTSVAWFAVEDDAGGRKMYSGCEFVDHYEQSVLQILGRGRFPQRYGEQDQRASYEAMAFPDSAVITKVAAQGHRNAWALDEGGNLWVWGYKLAYDDYYGEGGSDAEALIPGHHCNWTPCKVGWFETNGLRVVDFAAGEIYAICKVVDRSGADHLYAVLHPDYHYQARNCFGALAKEVLTKSVWKLEQITAGRLLSFDCGTYMTMIAYKPMEIVPSIIPGRETPSGLTHAYKEEQQWKFIAEDEYEARKSELPGLSLAFQYPFGSFEQKALALPDLAEVLAKIGIDEAAAATHGDLKSSASGEPIPAAEPLYCSVAKISGKEQRVYLTGDQVSRRDSPYRMDPLIFYRVSRPAKDITKLPAISLTKFYEQSSADEEQIRFTVKRVQPGRRTDSQHLAAISDPATIKDFEELPKFKADDDRQLMRCIDKFITDELKEKEIGEVQVEDFDFKKFALKNERLKAMSKQLLGMRCELFLKFTKQFIRASPSVDLAGKAKPGSLTHHFLRNKALALGSAKAKILEEKLSDLGGGGYLNANINRNKASVFATEGKVDHEGTQTIFGQFMQQCKARDASYAMFRQQGVESRCWSVNFVGEASADAGGPFRDSLDNVTKELESETLPLLIKTANNRNDHGGNRDCYMLNPSSRSPTHLEMFKFFGAFLSFAMMTTAPYPIHLAPGLWKQLLGDELEMSDLEGFDAYSSQVLVDLRDHSSKLSDEEFKNEVKLTFKTILSNGEEVNLKPGEEIETVTKENLTEYIDLVLKTRFNESKEQLAAMREGIKLVFTPELLPVLSIMDWEQVESRACGQKTIEIDKLKSITRYSGATEDSAIIKRFWRVLTSFDDDQRQMYLKFVWGRSRLPIDVKQMGQRHSVDVCRHMDKTGFPQAHTCFFSIDLPDYPNDKVMRDKFLTAITMCGEIDTDGTAMTDFNGDRIRGGNRWQDEEE